MLKRHHTTQTQEGRIMPYAQYLRIETYAGGVGCTNKQFIKACLRLINNKHSRQERDIRHAWDKGWLRYLKQRTFTVYQ